MGTGNQRFVREMGTIEAHLSGSFHPTIGAIMYVEQLIEAVVRASVLSSGREFFSILS